MPVLVLRGLHVKFYHSALIKTLLYIHYSYPNFTGEETKAQTDINLGKVKQVTEPRFSPRKCNYQVCTFNKLTNSLVASFQIIIYLYINLKRFHIFSVLRNYLYFFMILFIYFQREEKGGRKKGRETSMCGCLLCARNWGPGLEPWHVP